MSNNLHPCIWYNSNAKAAADFYCTLFPNSRITAENPMVVNFELSGQKFMGLNGGAMFKPNASISFFAVSEEDSEIEMLWNKLSEGGKIMMALDKYPWAERYGFVEDKFGLVWQIMKTKYENVNQKITPCLLFVGDSYGKAESAIHFYSTVFSTTTPPNIKFYEENEGEQVGKVKHAQFTLDGKLFMAMDGFGKHEFAFNEGISFVVECKDQAEIDYYWNKLTADGGQESMCGWLKDKYGVSWQIVPAALGELMSSPEKGQRVMAAIMQMKKLDIEELVHA
jgi:predicted 3-demethylubiquinone-9 3-methyltransferase (glyoxalase superfamily)